MSSEYKGKIAIDTADLKGGAEALKSFHGAVGLVNQALAGDLVGAGGRAKEVLGSLLETFSKFKVAGVVGAVAAAIAGGFKLYEAHMDKVLTKTQKFTEDVMRARHAMEASFGWNASPVDIARKKADEAEANGEVGTLAGMKADAERNLARAMQRHSVEPNNVANINAVTDANEILKLSAEAYGRAAKKQASESEKAHEEALKADTEALQERTDSLKKEREASERNAASLNKQADQIEEDAKFRAMTPVQRVRSLSDQLMPMEAGLEEADRLGQGTAEGRAQKRLEIVQLRQRRDAALEEAANEAKRKEEERSREAEKAAQEDAAATKAEADFRAKKLGKDDPEARKAEIGKRIWELENGLDGDPTPDQRKEHVDLLRELDGLNTKKSGPERGGADYLQDLRDAVGAGTVARGRLAHSARADAFRSRLGSSFAEDLQAGELTRQAGRGGSAYARADTRAEQLAQEHNALLKRLVAVTEDRLGVGD